MAVRCIRLGCDVISAISCGVRDPVDRVSCADPFADHGIPSFASPVSAARVVCGSHPVASVRSTTVAPSARRSRSITSASLLPSRGATACVCRPTSSALPLVFASGRGCGCAVSLGSIASSDPWSTAIAFNPAAVNLSANASPVSSRRQIGVPGFARISRAKPSFTSLALTLLAAAPFNLSGAARQRSSRCAAALVITSCAPVSLTVMIQPFLSSWKPGRSEPSPGRAPDRPKPKGRLGHVRVIRTASDNTPMLEAERKASPFCTEPTIVVNGRISDRPVPSRPGAASSLAVEALLPRASRQRSPGRRDRRLQGRPADALARRFPSGSASPRRSQPRDRDFHRFAECFAAGHHCFHQATLAIADTGGIAFLMPLFQASNYERLL